MSGAGYKVYDLGTNVSPDAFIAKVKEVHADILAMSNPCFRPQISERSGREAGGGRPEGQGKNHHRRASTTAATKDQVLADAWSKDGNECIQVCGRLMEELRA